MDTYVIIIFIILLLIFFVLQKNNKRFIIYSITGLKRYFDKELYIHSNNQKKNLDNINTNIHNMNRNIHNIHNANRVIYNKLHKYATKNDLKSYTDNLKKDLNSYVSKKDFVKYALNPLLSVINKKQNTKESFEELENTLNKLQNTQQKLVKNENDEKYKLLSKIVDTIIEDSKSKDNKSKNDLYDSYKPNWYK